MGKVTIEIPDEIEKDFRKKVVDKFGGKKGSIGMAIREAIEKWLKDDN